MNPDEAKDILGLEGDVSEDEVESAYRELSKNVHPDKGGSSGLFKRIKTARDTLLNSTSIEQGHGRRSKKSQDSYSNSSSDQSEYDNRKQSDDRYSSQSTDQKQKNATSSSTQQSGSVAQETEASISYSSLTSIYESAGVSFLILIIPFLLGWDLDYTQSFLAAQTCLLSTIGWTAHQDEKQMGYIGAFCLIAYITTSNSLLIEFSTNTTILWAGGFILAPVACILVGFASLTWKGEAVTGAGLLFSFCVWISELVIWYLFIR